MGVGDLLMNNNQSSPRQSGIRGATLIEIMVAVAVLGILAAMLLTVIGKQSGQAKDRTDYVAYRDALMAIAKECKWNYHEQTDPNMDRRIKELIFAPDVRDEHLHYLWAMLQRQFHYRFKTTSLSKLSFNQCEFSDSWMTNIIGVDRVGFPYRTEGLRILELDYTPVTDRGLAFLYKHEKAMQPTAGKIQAGLAGQYAMTNLGKISVYGCPNVTQAGIAELKRNIPGIVVISRWEPDDPDL